MNVLPIKYKLIQPLPIIDIHDIKVKTIFYANLMTHCNKFVEGFMEISPPNYKKAMEIFEYFPSLDGKAYFQFDSIYTNKLELTNAFTGIKEDKANLLVQAICDIQLNHYKCLEQLKVDSKDFFFRNSIIFSQKYKSACVEY